MISPRWSHLRWKTVAPARVDVRASGQVKIINISIIISIAVMIIIAVIISIAVILIIDVIISQVKVIIINNITIAPALGEVVTLSFKLHYSVFFQDGFHFLCLHQTPLCLKLDLTFMELPPQVVLKCTATGSPAPAVAWYKDGLFTAHPELADDQSVEHASLGETVAKLRLSCASKETVGNYECRARSGEQEVSAVTKVELADWSSGDLCSEAGTPEVAAWSPTLMVEEGTDAVLRCRAMSNEDNISTTWLNDKGEEVGKGERHSVTASGDLVVRDVSFADMGTYTCRLTNKMGSDQVDTFLYPLAPGN